MGVGSFVFANAIVSGAARMKEGGEEKEKIRKEEKERGKKLNIKEMIKKAVLSSIPLLVLGIGRLMATKSIEYHEHASEYGIHWNFFFTLAFLNLFSTILQTMRFDPLFGAFFFSILHQTMLKMGLQIWTLEAERKDLISMNKEGIVSCLGYLSLFLFGVSFGRLISSMQRVKMNVRSKGLWKMWALDFVLWIFSFASETFIDPPSRRLVNLTYISFVLSYNLFLLLLLLTLDLIFPSSRSSFLMLSLNYNALFFFLLVSPPSLPFPLS